MNATVYFPPQKSCHCALPLCELPTPQEHAPTYTAVYLESALDLGLASPGEVHSELLLIYLHMALEEERDGEQRCGHVRSTGCASVCVLPVHLRSTGCASVCDLVPIHLHIALAEERVGEHD